MFLGHGTSIIGWYLFKPMFVVSYIVFEDNKECFRGEANFSNVIDPLRTAKQIDILITIIPFLLCIPGWYFACQDSK